MGTTWSPSMRRAAGLWAAVVLAGGLGARPALGQRAPGATGRLEGDVYLLNKAGDVKPGASNTVLLLRPTTVAATCAAVRVLADSARRADSVARYSPEAVAAAARAALPSRAADAKARADSAFTVWAERQRLNPNIGIDERVTDLRMQAIALRDSVTRLKADGQLVPLPVLPPREDVRARLLGGPALRETWAPLSVQTAPTGMRAHYVFERAPVGDYVLFAETSLFDQPYVWLTRVRVSAGRAARQDLDNTVVFPSRYVCPDERP